MIPASLLPMLLFGDDLGIASTGDTTGGTSDGTPEMCFTSRPRPYVFSAQKRGKKFEEQD